MAAPASPGADPRLILPLCGVLFVAVSAACNGAAPGLGDQDIHEVFLGGGAFEHDLLGASVGAHPSLLFPIIAAARSVLPSMLVAMIGLVLCHLATGAAVGALARALVPERPGAWVLAAVIAAPAQAALGGAPTVDPLLLPRVAALPLLLAALALATGRRWAGAFTVAGLGLLVHAPSAVAALAGLLVAWVAHRRDAPWAPGLALLGAVPALVWLGPGGLDPLIVPESTWTLLEARLAHHLLPSTWPPGVWAAALVWFAVAALALRGSERGRPLAWVLGGVLGWATLAGLLGPLLRVRLLLNLEPWQGARLMVLLACVLAACRAAQAPRPWLAGAALCALTWLISPPPWRPGPGDASVYALGAWAREHTEPAALFVLPPDLSPGFRVASGRASFGTWKDGGEAQFAPSVGLEWARRMGALCLCEPFADLPREDPPFARSRALRARVGRGYDGRSADELLALAGREGATHLVVRGSIPAAVAEVGGFSVLRVPQAARGLGTRPAQ